MVIFVYIGCLHLLVDSLVAEEGIIMYHTYISQQNLRCLCVHFYQTLNIPLCLFQYFLWLAAAPTLNLFFNFQMMFLCWAEPIVSCSGHRHLFSDIGSCVSVKEHHHMCRTEKTRNGFKKE